MTELVYATEGVATLAPHETALVSVHAWPEADVEAWTQQLTRHHAQLGAFEAAQRAREALAPHFLHIDERTSAADIASAHDLVLRQGSRMARADRGLAEAARALRGEAGRIAVADALRLAELTADSADLASLMQRLYKTWAIEQIALAEASAPDARALAHENQREHAEARCLAQLEDERARHAAARVWDACERAAILTAPTPGKRERRSDVQATREEMLKEAKKQRLILPLRTFVQRFATRGLLDAVPVWLLSPETMVTLFPAQPIFDLVIFDEASQCTVANGFPVLSRAKRFVIAGDDKQMPPSAFFSAKAGTDEEEDEPQETRAEKTMLEDESLLTLAAARLERRSLAWHYRCRHESLIAFSNAAFYDGNLRTIPSPHGPGSTPMMRWTHVSDATYREGVNTAEAERVVDLVGELLLRPERPTVGVVTFNLKQRGAIFDAVDHRRAVSDSFRESWDAAMEHVDLDQRPFVKNLEQVQGDERDIIVFSLGHAPVQRKLRSGATEAYVPARFGPLGQRGGERRLNVAISRAKQEIHIVASFEPRLLNTARAKNRGPALFKSYLSGSGSDLRPRSVRAVSTCRAD